MPRATPFETRPQATGTAPAAPSAAPQTQSVRPVANPADRGGAAGTAPPAAEGGARVNLDGSSGSGNGNGSVPPPATGASAPLNLDLHGGGAGPSLGRTRSGLVPMLPAPAEKKSQLETDIEKAKRAKCSEAYGQEHGLLALPLLAKDAVTGKGCQW